MTTPMNVAQLIVELQKMPQDGIPVVNLGYNELANGLQISNVSLVQAFRSTNPRHRQNWQEDYDPSEDREEQVKQIVVNISIG